MNETDLIEDSVLVLDWSRLEPEQIDRRITWLRESLTAGEDWGYSTEVRTCVLMNSQASMLYKLVWFEPNKQELIDRPEGLKLINIDGTRG